MTTNDADRLLTAWLVAAAPTREPEHLLGAVLERTSRTRRRPAWQIPERWTAMTTISARVTAGGRFPWQLAAAVVLLILALVAGTLLLAGARQVNVPPPFGPAANGSFAYEVDNDVLLRDPSGRVTSIPEAVGPLYSLDGTRLAWLHRVERTTANVERLELRVGNADGSGARALGIFDDVTAGAWSPDGATIAVGSSVDGRASISIVDVVSGKGTVLDLGMAAREPAYRPGGRQLLFGGQPDGEPWGFYLVGLDGTGLVPLVLDPGFENTMNYAGDEAYYFLAPNWSPSGDRLAFHTLEEPAAPSDRDPGWRVHVADIDAAGRVMQEITLPVDPSIDDEFNPAWLPDGSGLVVQRLEEGVHSLARWPIAASEPGAPQALGLAPAAYVIRDLAFTIAPDGTDVAAWDVATGRHWRVPVDGRPASEVDLGNISAASWQRTATAAP